MDETFVGGQNIGQGRENRYKNKEIVIGIRQRGGELRLFHVDDVKSGTLQKYIRENISEDVDVLFTDDFLGYRSAAADLRKQGRHKTIRHSLKIYVKGDIHTNTVESAFSLLKRGILGTWHKMSAKHLAAYLQEMEFRFNRRKNPNLFVDTLRHMVTAPVLTFERLTA
jgi:transposase-like protein